ncbi:MAG: hypothetical protein EOM87_10235 [Clostridia bacterium]|nr:hypothetical protein [Clostridia bacterium]
MFAKLQALIISALIPCGCALGNGVGESKKLTVREDGTFKILHLTDFHLYLAEEGQSSLSVKRLSEPDASLINYLDSVLEAETPDLVVLGGDNVFCNSTIAEIFYNTSIRTYRTIADYFEEKAVFWTFVFGNHDTEGGCSKKRILKALEDYSRFIGGKDSSEYFGSYCIESKGSVYFEDEKLSAKYAKDDRYGNYSIPIYDSGASKIVYAIFTLDTGSYYSPPPSGMPYKELIPVQYDWLNTGIADLIQQAEADINYLIFLHIPYFDEVAEALGPVNAAHLDGIFAGHSHYNYTAIDYIADKPVINAVTGCCFEDSVDYTGERNARSIIIDTILGTVTTYCLDRDAKIIAD